MKKIFPVLFSGILVIGLIFQGSIFAGEFLERAVAGMEGSFKAGFETVEGRAMGAFEEGAVKNFSEPFNETFTKIDEQLKTQYGEGTPAYDRAVGDVIETFSDLAEDLGGNIKGTKIGEYTYEKIDVTSLDDLTTHGVPDDVIQEAKKVFDDLDATKINEYLKEGPKGSETPVSESEALEGNERLTARKKVSNFIRESQVLKDLKGDLKKLEDAGASPEDTASLKEKISDQEKLVDAYGYKTSGWAVDLYGKLKGYADTVYEETAGRFGKTAGELRAARSNATSALSDLREATDTYAKAQEKVTKAQKAMEAKPEGSPERVDLQTKVDEAQGELKTAKDAYETALDNYTKADEVLEGTSEKAWKDWASTAKQEADVKEINMNRGLSGDTEIDVASAKAEYEEARNAAKEHGNFSERVKLTAKDLAKEKFKFIFETLIAGVLFMIPGTALQYYQDQKAREALLETISAPQSFGGIWMQIPRDLINVDNPLKSVFLYAGVEPGGECTLDALLGGKRCDISDKTVSGETQFFVAEGGDDFENWAQAPITSTNFSGKMINLNTGYTFFADGKPVDAISPAKRLLNNITQKKDAMGKAPVSVTDFLQQITAVLRGTTKIEEFNPAGDAVGGLAAGIEEEGEGEEVPETYVTSDFFADLLSPSDDQGDKTCTVNQIDIKPCADILENAIISNLSGTALWGGSIVNIWPLRILTTEEIKNLTGESVFGAADLSDQAMPLFGIYIYETTFTELGKQLNHISGGDAGKGKKGIVADYVFALDENSNIVPLKVPQIEDGKIVYVPNENVTGLYSLLSGLVTDQDGKTGKILADLSGQDAYHDVASSMWVQKQLGVVDGWYEDALKNGPFEVAGKTLTIDSDLSDDGIYVYTLDPAKQTTGSASTLEDGGIDYLIAYDDNNNIVNLGTHKDLASKFLSLVSSRYYDKNLYPFNKENGHDDVEFVVASCNNIIAVGTPPVPAGCISQQLGIEPGPYKAPLYTLFMDADINPYNKPSLMNFMLKLGGHIGTKAASLFESAFEQAGVTEKMMQLSTENLDALIQVVSDGIWKNLAAMVDPTTGKTHAQIFQDSMEALNKAIDDWQNAGRPTSGDIYNAVVSAQGAYTSVSNALVDDIQKNGSNLGAIGDIFAQQVTNISPEFIAALNDVQNQLGTAAPKVDRSPTSAANYVKQGRIPVPNQWGLNQQGSTIKKAVESRVNERYSAWKTKVTEEVEDWDLFTYKGPFDMTPPGSVVEVTIEATSIDDLRRGVYVYTSPDFAGEFLLIGSGTTSPLLGKRFDVLNKINTPYILSLSTGKVFSVEKGDLKVQTDVDASYKIPENLVSLVKAKFNLADSDQLVQAIIKSQAALREKRKEQEFDHAFYHYNLFLDSQDSDDGVYIYQDITNISGARDMDSSELLGKVQNFLAYGEKQADGTIRWGLELPDSLNADSRMVNLVSGIIYKSSGSVGRLELYPEPGGAEVATGLLGALNELLTAIELQSQVNVGQPTSIRDALKKAIRDRVSKSVDEAQKAIEDYATERQKVLQGQGYPLLDTGTVSELTKIKFIPGYPNLKLFGGKYYQVYSIVSEDPPMSVLDYSVKSETDPTLPAIGILYRIEYAGDGVTPIGTHIEAELTGEILDVARASAGVIIKNGAQSLGLPHEQPALDVSKITSLPGFDPVSLKGTSYEFKAYKGAAMLYVTPPVNFLGQKMPPFYLDLYSGVKFDKSGRPISIGGYFAENTEDGRYLLVTRSNDGSLNTVLYESTLGWVYEFEIKDIPDNPKASYDTPDGNYQVTPIIMQDTFLGDNHILIKEHKPKATGLNRYYEVTEQSAITYSGSDEVVYFNNPAQTFNDKGPFKSISYARGASEEAFLLPSDAYVLTTVDSAGVETTEAIIWDDTKSDEDLLLYPVVYKSQNGKFVADFKKCVGDGDIYFGECEEYADTSATINFKNNLVDQDIQQAYGINAYYNEITDFDNNITYQFLDKLSIIQKDDIKTIDAGIGVSLVSNYQGRTELVKTLPTSLQTMNAGNLAGNFYKAPNDKRELEKIMGAQLNLVKVKKANTSVKPQDVRYLYQVGSWIGDNVYKTGDQQFQFYKKVGTGNYIDLESGVAYSSQPPFTPITVISPAELVLLRSVVTHVNVLFIPECQISNTCKPGQQEPKRKVITYFA